MAKQSDVYPDVVDVDNFIAGNSDSVYNQLVWVALRHPTRTREFAVKAATEVAARFCTHGEEVPRSLEGTTSAS